MVSTDQVLAFALVSVVLIAIPGPSVLFVVGRALSEGRRSALATVLGNAAGCYVVAAAVALGVGTAVQQSAVLFTAVTLAGAAYLVWLGIAAIRKRGSTAGLTKELSSRSQRRALRDGFVVGVANPKAFVLFASVLPQFVDREAGHVAVQMLLLALIAPAISIVSDGLWAVAAGSARSWITRSPRRSELITATGGLALVGVGVSVAVREP